MNETSTQEWTDEQHADYALGMQTEREHQEALARLAMKLNEARIADLEVRVDELKGYNAALGNESFRLNEENRKLRAQVAARPEGSRWQPIEDGVYLAKNPKDDLQVETIEDEVWLTVTEVLIPGRSERVTVLILLPDNLRLCCLVDAAAPP